jgi:hypothetical protein
MDGLAWGALAIGLVIAALAVGVPYYFTHRRMRAHHDVSDSHEYLRGRRRLLWQRRVAGARWQGTTGQEPGSDPGPTVSGGQPPSPPGWQDQ